VAHSGLTSALNLGVRSATTRLISNAAPEGFDNYKLIKRVKCFTFNGK